MHTGTLPNSSYSAAVRAANYTLPLHDALPIYYATSTGSCEPFTVNAAATSTSTIVKDHGGNTIDSGSNKAALGDRERTPLNSSSASNAYTVSCTISYKLYT